MRINVRGGTVSNAGVGLCESCRNGTVIRGDTEKQKIVLCGMMERQPVGFEVRECGSYDDRRRPSLSSMRQIAWDLDLKGGRKAGFTAPKRDEDEPHGPLVTPTGDIYW
jgi:hypothetical protein